MLRAPCASGTTSITTSPCWVNLTALPIRLTRICLNRVTSLTRILGMVSSTRQARSSFFSAALVASNSMDSSMQVWSSKGWYSRSSWPDSDLDLGNGVVHQAGQVELLLGGLGRKQFHGLLNAGMEFEGMVLQVKLAGFRSGSWEWCRPPGRPGRASSRRPWSQAIPWTPQCRYGVRRDGTPGQVCRIRSLRSPEYR